MAKIVGGLATVPTIAAAGGYAMEKWNETKATVDFVGEIDQKKPFTVPLSIKNPSLFFRYIQLLCLAT